MATLEESLSRIRSRHERYNRLNDAWVRLGLFSNVIVTGAEQYEDGFFVKKEPGPIRAHLNFRIPVRLVFWWFDCRSWVRSKVG